MSHPRSTPPDNLPVAPLGTPPFPGATIPVPVDLEPDDVAQFRAALEQDLGDTSQWSDEDIRTMAIDSVRAIALIIAIQRRIPRE